MALVALAGSGVAAAEPQRPIVSTLGWTTEVDTFVQVDAIPYSQQSLDEVDPGGTGAPLNEESVLVRRGFLRVEATRDDYFAELELDGNTVRGPAARIVTSQVGWRLGDKLLPLVRVRGGLLLIPFGSLVPQNVRFRDFMEQPTFLRALFPGDADAGVNADGAYGLVRWSVAAMNGAPVADAQWQGRDPVSSYDLMGRLGTEVPLPGRGRFVAGVSALTGTGLHPGTPPTKDSIQWIDENMDGLIQITELMDVPGSPGVPSQQFERDALDLDATWHWCLCALGNGMLQFEGAIAKNLDRGVIYADPIARSRDVRELGFSLALEQELGPWALAGVRYDRYDADRDAAERDGVTTVYTHAMFSTVSVLAAAKWKTSRLSVQYDHVTNPFGRSDSGAPTTQRADRVTLRGQVEF
ncbi:MAG: hypothetical protein ABI467_27295 [Kofleriaceae bacterium]